MMVGGPWRRNCHARWRWPVSLAKMAFTFIASSRNLPCGGMDGIGFGVSFNIFCRRSQERSKQRQLFGVAREDVEHRRKREPLFDLHGDQRERGKWTLAQVGCGARIRPVLRR